MSSGLILLALLAYQLSLLLWQMVPEPEYQTTVWAVPTSSAQTPEQGMTASQKTAQIASSQLFGLAQKEPVVVAALQLEDAPESSLSYKLRGIYFSSDKSLASVILQKDSNNTNYYRLGDEIDNKIYIEQINQDSILISRHGRLEKLLMEKPTADLRAAAPAAARASPSDSSASRVLQSYKRRYSDNPLALAKRFQAIPVSENGKNIGYKLKALRGESLLKKLGMQDDDVFVAVNGIGLDKPFQALDALKSLTTAKDVSLTVIRNGNRETVDFNL